MSRRMRSVKRSTGGEHIAYGPARRVVKAVHIAPSDEGRWTVSKAGKTRVRRVFSDKAAAMRFVKDLEPLRSSEVMLHKRDGTVQVGKVAKSGQFKVSSDTSLSRHAPSADASPKG